MDERVAQLEDPDSRADGSRTGIMSPPRNVQ